MFCYSKGQYIVTVMCVCYGNVLLQYSTWLFLCACITVMCFYSKVQCSVTDI